MTQGSLGLAIAAYQEGDPDLARQTLDNAARLDPNDPDIPLTAAVMDMDRSEADAAILQAREAIRRHRLVEGRGVSALAATRGGNNTLGAAFDNLSLTDWADYYNELSFDPYSAESHFYRALHAYHRWGIRRRYRRGVKPRARGNPSGVFPPAYPSVLLYKPYNHHIPRLPLIVSFEGRF